jgi:hypothetical protein
MDNNTSFDDDLEAQKQALLKLSGQSKPFDPTEVMGALSTMESSGGQNRNHPTVESGVQSGTHAVSSYGLMPNTIYELANRNKDFQGTPEGQAILETNGNPEQINKLTQDPQVDNLVMKHLLLDQDKRLAPIYEGSEVDPDVASVLAHRRGVAGAIKAIRNNSALKDPYVQRYLQLKNKPGV